jgi:ATP/maltotriose-dependent transcriptional regulator MalT
MDEAEVYARAAESAHLSGDKRAIELVQAAIDNLDARKAAYRAALLRERLGRYLFVFVGDMEEAQGAYQKPVDLLPVDEPRPEMAQTLAALGQILMLRGRTAESMERCEQAISVARAVGARAEEAHALNTLGSNLAFLGDRPTGINYLRESLRISEELDDINNLARTYVDLSEMLDEDGQIEAAIDLALAGAARAGELGMQTSKLLEGEASLRLISLGRLDEADRLTEAALELPPSTAALMQSAARAHLALQRGRTAEAELLIRAAEEAMPHMPGPTWTEPLASARVDLELLHGHPEEARRLGEEALKLAADGERVVFTARLHAVAARAGAVLAERARAAGDEAAAAEAAARAGALVDRIGRLLDDPEAWLGRPPPETLAYREVCRAEAARAAGAATASDWTAIAERWAALGMRLEEAYARLREAECLVLDDKRKLADEALAAGLGTARDCGARWLQEQLEALARRGRLSLPAADGPVVGDAVERLGLTERELAVLRLVALGKTNREIGEELFMAQKTASVHVSRILTKLEVSSRLEAATAAQRLGLVP